jgi:parallel beta-helix repeat protein
VSIRLIIVICVFSTAAVVLPPSAVAAPKTTASPDGTIVPTTATQIVDNNGAVWTIVGGNTILRNGVQAAGGSGSQIYWKSSTIYVLSGSTWWQWNGSGWLNIGSTVPGTTTSGPTVSGDGTTVPTNASQIVDNNGGVWTIGAGNAILRNGVQAAGGYGSQIYWKSSTIYVLNGSTWWQWNGSGWLNVGSTVSGSTTSGPTVSGDGTTVPTNASQIVDSNGAVWTIGAGGMILRNGSQAGGGWGSQILWKSSTIYVLGTDNNWYQWTGSGWVNIGKTIPGGSTTSSGGSTASPDGAIVPTTATQIIDTAGAVWTIGSGGMILRNGSQAAGGSGSQILWKSSTIYVLGANSSWYQWTGSGWINVGTTMPGTTSSSSSSSSGGGSPSPTAVGPQSTITCPAGAVNIWPGTSIQNVVNSYGASTTFCVKAGVYSLFSSITPKTGDVFIGEYGAILDGSGWSTSDDTQAAFRAHNQDIDYVTVRNFVIRNMPQRGIHAYYYMADHWTVEYNEIATSKNVGIVFPGYSSIRNNYIHHNTFGGYMADYSHSTTLDSNEIAYNGTQEKVSESDRVTFRNNYVHHNAGGGIWFDSDNTNTLIEGNRVEDNGSIGIWFEIGSGVIIRNNVIRRSADTGVFISTSKNAEIYNNTLENNFRGITYFVNCPSVGAGAISFDLANNSAHDNTITVGTQTYAFASVFNYSNCTSTQIAPYQNGLKNLTFSHNTYHVPSPTSGQYWYWVNFKYWSQWQAIPQDATSGLSQ